MITRQITERLAWCNRCGVFRWCVPVPRVNPMFWECPASHLIEEPWPETAPTTHCGHCGDVRHVPYGDDEAHCGCIPGDTCMCACHDEPGDTEREGDRWCECGAIAEEPGVLERIVGRGVMHRFDGRKCARALNGCPACGATGSVHWPRCPHFGGES